MKTTSITQPIKQYGSTTSTVIWVVMVLIVSIGVTVALFGPKEIKKSFFARSIGEAADSCEKEIIDHFDDRLVTKYYDQISSRYEAERKQYIVYYRVSHAELINDMPTIEYSMAKCVVWESLGYVSEFRVFKP